MAASTTLQGITGAIFDLDGTLLDSNAIWDTVGSRYLLAQGITPEADLDALFQTFSIQQAASHYITHYGLNQSIKTIIDGVNAMIDQDYAHTLTTKAGVPQALSLMAQAGIAMTIATATDRYMVEAALAHNGIDHYFTDIITCTEVGAGKDSPLIYRRALQVMGTAKETTLVFEDAPFAMTTAQADGFRIVGVADDAWPHSQDAIVAMAEDYITDYTHWSKS